MKHKRKFWIFLPVLALILTLALRILPSFNSFWAGFIALPVLGWIRASTSHLPFVLLEWGCLLLLAFFALLWLFYFIRHGFRRASAVLVKCLVILFSALLLSFGGLWLPLYPQGTSTVYAATNHQLIASCEQLIGELNASELDFSIPTKDLPAKTVRFPAWMRAFNISGFFSFPTGEALISPELDDRAAPFVAVHEHMHALGLASEGEANIAAWEECLRRGGSYATSARLWALKYSMDALYRLDSQAYTRCRRLMSEETFSAFRAVGGGRPSQVDNDGIQAVFAALGVAEAASDYEILAVYLASQMPQ